MALTPELIVATCTGITTLVAAVGGNYVAFQKLRLELHEKTSQQTQILTRQTERLSKKFDHGAELSALQFSEANNFNTKVTKIQEQNGIIWRHLKALEKAMGVEIKEEE